MSKRGGGSGGHPRAPGWYDDPFSATGTGERYWDGQKWGTNERPLGRHTVARGTALDTSPVSGRAGKYRALAVFLVFVIVGALLLPQLRGDSGDSDDSFTPPSTTIDQARPPAGTEVAPSPLGTPVDVPAGTGGYEVIRTQSDDPTTPVGFDPCRPVHYVVNPKGAPANGAALVKNAIATVHEATGLQFVDDGATDETPDKGRRAYLPDRYDPNRWAPVLIVLSDETAYPKLAGYVAGVGGADAVYAPSGPLVNVSGQVVFDRADPVFVGTTPDQARAVVLHELGHLVGLDHTADRAQVMFSESEFNVVEYGAGDRRGLAAVGTRDCFPDL